MSAFAHGVIQSVLAALLRGFGLHAATEVTLRLSPTKYLVPDVIAARRWNRPTRLTPYCCAARFFPQAIASAQLSQSARSGEPTRVTQMLHAGEIVITLSELFSALDK